MARGRVGAARRPGSTGSKQPKISPLLRSRAHADYQPIDTQGPYAPEEETRDAGPQIRQGPEEESCGPAAARSVHARVHDDAEEAELGAAQGCAREADQ